MLQIQPISDAFGKLIPFLFKPPHGLFAFCVKCSNAELFNVSFCFRFDFLFNLKFNRKPVRIPARFAQHIISLQGFIPAHNILKYARNHMMQPGTCVRGRRTFKKHELRTIGLRVHTLKYPLFLPKIQNTLFQIRKRRGFVLVRVFFFHTHDFQYNGFITYEIIRQYPTIPIPF